MLNLFTGKSSDCTGQTRREFLTIGGLSVLGLTLPSLFRWQEAFAAQGSARKTVNCILLWMQGGPSHIDTFDPKPDAPVEIRGEFKTIPTALPGVRFTEHVPQLATLNDLLSLIRGHDPKNASHGAPAHIKIAAHNFNR